MLYKYLLLGLFALFSPVVFGQGETANWYFGNGAGIRFNDNGTVTPLTDGKLNTFEGCTSISDVSGNLILYTDGITVYDRNHNIMPNGTGLYGDPSSTQSAIVVQKPDDPNILYIFTVDTRISEEDFDRGFNYSVVDLTLNGGNGAITQKNINLLVDCSEKLTAVIKDCLDKSIWVVTFGPETNTPGPFNTYYAFEVDENGVQATPVKSTFSDIEIVDPRGYLKFSPDGSVLASANANDGLFLYDFDKTTGTLFNQQVLKTLNSNYAAYGLEYSPNQQFLYVHTTGVQSPSEPDIPSSSLIQYDLTAPDISASEVELDRRAIFRGALQLGRNGKIYRTIAQDYLQGSPYLGVIENPNEKGTAANYVHNAVFLNNRNATQGLPPFIQSFFDRIDLVQHSNGTTGSTLTLCEGEGFTLQGEDLSGATYSWAKDGTPFANSSFNFSIDPATPADSGRYTLEIIPGPGECPIVGEAFVLVSPIPKAEPLILTQCDAAGTNSSDGIATFNLEEIISTTDDTYSFYESMTDVNNENPIANPEGYINTNPFDQTIYYKIENTYGCSDVNELQLRVVTIELTDGEKTFYACDLNAEDQILEGIFDLVSFQEIYYPNQDVAFYTSLEDASLEQNPISGNFSTTPTTIFARIEEKNQCEDVDRINLSVNPTPSFSYDEKISWCTDGPPLSIDAPNGYDLYRWYRDNGNQIVEVGNQQRYDIAQTGSYFLEMGYTYITNEGTFECFNQVDFEVIPSNRAIIENVDVQDLSNNNLVEILVSGDGNYEYSLDGINYQDEPQFNNAPPGFITAYVRDKNGCGITKKLISVIGYPKFFTPNGDGINDSWQILGVDGQVQAESVTSIFNRYGKLVAQLNSTTEAWNGMFNNNELPASEYWFRTILSDGRELKGHFTLKR